MKKLPISFYRRDDVLQVARELLGKLLVTRFDGVLTSGRIVECEAYAGVHDLASHAKGGRRTARTEVMYGLGGLAYVYLCYGIHHLFNVVTNKRDIPHAILIRGVEPVEGIDEMLLRSGRAGLDRTLTRGPGNVSRALGIHTAHTGMNLTGDTIYLADDGRDYTEDAVGSSPRIGVEYAGASALWAYRFYVRGNPYVSGKPVR